MTTTRSSKRSTLLSFHRPKLSLDEAPIPILKPESKARTVSAELTASGLSRCLQNLLMYQQAEQQMALPKSRCAAVLVALFVGRMGDLRAPTLRTFAGDTSLPGGKWEPQDRNMEGTARREAFEEIGLPMDQHKVPLLCVLEPVLAGHNLIIIPVVVLILDVTIRPILNTAEVASLFSHPLISLLHSNLPFLNERKMPELEYHTYSDTILSLGPQRLHRFLTGREVGGTKPIFGLTAGILIHVAIIGYGRAPDFELDAPGQPSWNERIAYALKHSPVFLEAMQKEGIDPSKIPDPSSFRNRVGVKNADGQSVSGETREQRWCAQSKL
ncbi:uncharacterized protein FIBRA_09414 [Fibroporia radiculosa]|uniref:Nudix hydrolase domain-containing protein n=1 Tax=Fibroporia radiculosa TaxID=599839 RepID=J7SD09_9APHY|nr:uncharacterized protein FIBRA_09414 [Fibroporia radiculosa]CCM07088.1 predicted protein [Fibroporia radiculosa]